MFPFKVEEVNQGWPRRILALLFGHWDTVQFGYTVYFCRVWRGVYYAVWITRLEG